MKKPCAVKSMTVQDEGGTLTGRWSCTCHHGEGEVVGGGAQAIRQKMEQDFTTHAHRTALAGLGSKLPR